MHGDIQKDGVRVTEVEAAKQELLSFARRHDAARAARRKPVRTVLIAAGIGLVAGRVLLGGAARRGIGRRLMGVLVGARLASLYVPAILRGLSEASRLYRSAAGAVRPGARGYAASAAPRPVVLSRPAERSVVH
jgi:hypothetical protein